MRRRSSLRWQAHNSPLLLPPGLQSPRQKESSSHHPVVPELQNPLLQWPSWLHRSVLWNRSENIYSCGSWSGYSFIWSSGLMNFTPLPSQPRIKDLQDFWGLKERIFWGKKKLLWTVVLSYMNLHWDSFTTCWFSTRSPKATDVSCSNRKSILIIGFEIQ